MFEPGNKLAVGKGRPKGTGKNQLFRTWCLEFGVQKLLDTAAGKGHGWREHNGRLVELGPDPWLQFEALKLALAYGLGRPIVPFKLTEGASTPEEAKMRADQVWKLINELEATSGADSGGNGNGNPAGLENRPA